GCATAAGEAGDEAEQSGAEEYERERLRHAGNGTGEVEALVHQVDLLDVEGESVQSSVETGEGEHEWRGAVWSDIRTLGVAVVRSHGTGGLKDQGTVEEDRDGIVRQDAQCADVVGQVAGTEVEGGAVDVVTIGNDEVAGGSGGGVDGDAAW